VHRFGPHQRQRSSIELYYAIAASAFRRRQIGRNTCSFNSIFAVGAMPQGSSSSSVNVFNGPDDSVFVCCKWEFGGICTWLVDRAQRVVFGSPSYHHIFERCTSRSRPIEIAKGRGGEDKWANNRGTYMTTFPARTYLVSGSRFRRYP
jgi:hypothetical protein